MSIKSVSIVKKQDYHEIHEIERTLQISHDGEICLALGGDGTFLEATKKCDRPILHIRDGERTSLGFRADVTLSDLREILTDLKQGRYLIERYSKLRITYGNQRYDAVNDVVLFREGSKAIHFSVSYYDYEGNELPLYPEDVRGDGIVFSRQIGSTAYNFYAHGPILFDVDAVVVTPITSNHAFSIVTNRDFLVKVIKREGILEYDGVRVAKLVKGDSFNITKSDKVVKIVKLDRGEGFSNKLARLRSY